MTYQFFSSSIKYVKVRLIPPLNELALSYLKMIPLVHGTTACPQTFQSARNQSVFF